MLCRTKSYFFKLLVCFILFVASAPFQAAGAERKYSVGLDGGIFLPTGTWKEHPFASRVDQFQKDYVIRFDIEARYWQRLGLGIDFGFIALDAGDWERYAAEQGDAITASASIFYTGIVFKPYLWFDENNLLKLNLGFNIFASSGEEAFGRFTYDYDFLGTDVGFLFGIEYNYILNENIAIALKPAVVLIPTGLEYADGDPDAITGFPLTAGIRFLF
ncbi:MAG: hypothetical protein GTO51_11240 [Candidatus Latescibacteria bacterium]|nr:hypothetical protein [Candidatus Latescibacterota bacterium]NIM66538.1 hypothetical protein [Candidatus Latescibacterota bacterium]NIO03019.1 hypothetical protein [Candidatus Latescibacterota bacterium]NIO30155.1 hypothetical protein [Candidatus Latescibacterota bacterium]NIO57772.1 hypothetical protein [Candidatus Latescibacterota bacterium]